MAIQISGTNGITFPDNTVRGSSSLVAGGFKNLSLSATGTNSLVNITADAVVLEDANFSPLVARSVNVNIDFSVVGANGLAATSVANTWYALWIIWNGTTVAGFAGLSATSPTLPSGYTHKARVGWARTDSTGNKYPLNFIQYGRAVRYRVAAGSNVTAPPTITSGSAGTTTTWVAASISNFVPTTAFLIQVQVVGPLTTGQFVGCAPNATYNTNIGNINSTPVQIEASSTLNSSASGSFMLESSNVYYNSNQASASLLCLGWEDNI